MKVLTIVAALPRVDVSDGIVPTLQSVRDYIDKLIEDPKPAIDSLHEIPDSAESYTVSVNWTMPEK